MKTLPPFCQLRRLEIPRCATIMLVALLWCSAAFCSEIYDAVDKGDLKKVKALLESTPDLVFSNNAGDGWTPLFRPVMRAQKEMAELLLAYNADVNAQDIHGWTPLHCVAMGNPRQIEMAKLLLTHEANVNARDKNGLTPLDMASVTGHADIAALLLASKADVNARDKNGQTPLHYAESSDVAKLLLTNKAQIDARDNKGMTPLHHAAILGWEDVAKVLLANGADVNARDKEGRTPLGEAIHYPELPPPPPPPPSAIQPQAQKPSQRANSETHQPANSKKGAVAETTTTTTNGTNGHQEDPRTDVENVLRQHGGHE